MKKINDLNFDFNFSNGERGFVSKKIKEELTDQLKLENEFLDRPSGEDIQNNINLEEINRKYFMERDVYYRVGHGLSSKLLGYSQGIFTLEIVSSRKWSKDYNTTAQELAYLWKNSHSELSNAIGCKVYIIDTKIYDYKQALINKGIKPGYDAKKGIIFRKGYLN